jgi:hypothetical protein
MDMFRRAHICSALAAVLFCASGVAHSAAHDTAIKDIIPHRKVGSEVCFEGSFTDKTLDMKGWPSYAGQAHPKIDAGGKLAASSQTRQFPGQTISNVALHLTYTNGRRARNESWDFDFTVKVTSPSLGQELFARSGCTWSGWDNEMQKEIKPEFMLSCWIECDGGSMRAMRIPGTGSLNLYFSKLFMQSGCEGGGRYSVADSEASEKVAFHLERAPMKACKSLKDWDRE